MVPIVTLPLGMLQLYYGLLGPQSQWVHYIYIRIICILHQRQKPWRQTCYHNNIEPPMLSEEKATCSDFIPVTQKTARFSESPL